MKLSISLVSKIILAVAIIVLIGTAYSMNRDYQDSWILHGLEVPFVLFIVTFTFAFYFEKRLLRRVTLAVLGRTVFMLIPTVKYVWFQGPWIDQNAQQALANHVVTTGHIMTSPTVEQVYSSSPLMHLYISISSLIPNVPVASLMKYLPVFLSILFPLLIYIMAKNILQGESTFLGYALFISAIPISNIQYVVSGSLFGCLFIQIILTILVLMYVKNTRYFWPILAFSIIVLAAAHSVSSMILTGVFLILLLLRRFPRFGFSSFLSDMKALVLILIVLAWFMFAANATLETIVQVFSVELPAGTNPVSERIGTGSFSVLRTNPLAAIVSLVVFYGADIFFLLLTIAGLLLMFLMRKRLNQVSRFFAIFYFILLVLAVVGTIVDVGGRRVLFIAELLFPIFASTFIISILRKKSRIRKLIVGVIFFMILFLATIQFYGYQPFVPPANVLYKDLPSNIQLGYVGIVNTIYQRQMIIFAEENARGVVAAVFPITTQIVGLTNESFSLKVLSYDPLDKSMLKPYYDYLLINMPGPAGHYSGNADLLLNDPLQVSAYISNQTIIYSNGESYILNNSN